MIDLRERVAEAIYMAHWQLPAESSRGLEHRFPPTWETASGAVKDWVRKQAEAAIAAMDGEAEHLSAQLARRREREMA